MQFRALILCSTAVVACGTLYSGGSDDYYVGQQMATQEDEAAAIQAIEVANKLLDYIKPKLQKFVKGMFHNKTELTYGDHNATCALGLSSCEIHLNKICLLNPPDFRDEAACIVEIGNLHIEVSDLVSGAMSVAFAKLTGYELGGKVKINQVMMRNVTLSVQKYSSGTNFGTLIAAKNEDKKEEKKKQKEEVETQGKVEPEIKTPDGAPSYKVKGYVGIKDFNIELRTSWIGKWLGDKHVDEVKLFDEQGRCGKIVQTAGFCEDNDRDPKSFSLLGVVWQLLKFIIGRDVPLIGSSAL